MKCIQVAMAWLSLVLTAAPSGFEQNFSIETRTPGGAGRSSGGTYLLEGHIGQTYPAHLAGGDYLLESETFGLPLQTTPGEVQLLASYSNGTLTLLWDRAAAGFQLETADSLGGALPWSTVELSPQANATHFFVTIPAAGQHQFFRLRRP